MAGPEWLILWIAPAIFLLISSLRLITEELISLVVAFKKLKATMKSGYWVSGDEGEVRHHPRKKRLYRQGSFATNENQNKKITVKPVKN